MFPAETCSVISGGSGASVEKPNRRPRGGEAKSVLLCRTVRAASPRILLAPVEAPIAAYAQGPWIAAMVPHLLLMDDDREDE